MTKGHELGVLTRRECLDRLDTVRVGRLVVTEDALPSIQPVNFRLWRDDVVIKVAGGAKLAAATEHQVVAFEADDLDPELRTGWSVTVVGHAEPVTGIDDLVQIAGTFVQPWAEGRREHFIRIRTEKVTGRQLRDHTEPHFHGVAQSLGGAQ